MGIRHQAPTHPHWNYFVVLEQDLEKASRFVEFAEANFQAYSLEFAHLLFAAASEVEVVMKQLCELFKPGENPGNMPEYRNILRKKAHLPHLGARKVTVPRFGLTLQPWENWLSETEGQIWWASYNSVKHARHTSFHEATLKNALNAVAGLYLLVLELASRKREGDDINLLEALEVQAQRMEPRSRMFVIGGS